jgi:hypothetical protein
MTKRKIYEQVDKIESYDIGDVDLLIVKLYNIKEKYSPLGFVYLYLHSSEAYESEIRVCVEREETDKEYQKRINAEKKQKQQKVNQKETKKKQELQLLARLKKKYEGKE